MSWEFCTNFSSKDREDKLDTLLDELKSKLVQEEVYSNLNVHLGNLGNLRPALLLGLVGKANITVDEEINL